MMSCGKLRHVAKKTTYRHNVRRTMTPHDAMAYRTPSHNTLCAQALVSALFFAMASCIALRIPIVIILAVAQVPTEADYTVAACNANSRAEAILRTALNGGALPPRHARYGSANGVREEHSYCGMPRGPQLLR